MIPSLTVFAALLALWPAIARTDTLPVPGTESNAGSTTDGWLITRGLIGHGMVGEQSDRSVMTPPPGVEVDEVQQTEDRTGEIVMRAQWWNELIGDDTVHIEVTTLSSDQFEVAFWLLPNHRQGCTMYQWTLYDHGRALQSMFWRNDAMVLRMAGAPELPHDLYPDAVPWMAFLRVLDSPREGARGALHQQITPYSYVGQDVSATGVEQITVRSGDGRYHACGRAEPDNRLGPHCERGNTHAREPDRGDQKKSGDRDLAHEESCFSSRRHARTCIHRPRSFSRPAPASVSACRYRYAASRARTVSVS